MTKSGGQSPPLQILGGLVPPSSSVIYAHAMTQFLALPFLATNPGDATVLQ